MSEEENGEFAIGALARMTGLAPSALRFYEARGLLRPVRRQGGKRLYDASSVRTVRSIRLAQAAGFSLSDAQELNEPLASGEPLSNRWRALAARKVVELDRLIEDAMAAKARIAEAVQCRCHDASDCPLFGDASPELDFNL